MDTTQFRYDWWFQSKTVSTYTRTIYLCYFRCYSSIYTRLTTHDPVDKHVNNACTLSYKYAYR